MWGGRPFRIPGLAIRDYDITLCKHLHTESVELNMRTGLLIYNIKVYISVQDQWRRAESFSEG